MKGGWSSLLSSHWAARWIDRIHRSNACPPPLPASSVQVEVAVLHRDAATKEVVQRFYTPAEVDALLKEITAAAAPSGDV